jgi:hypothetical protein
MLMDITWIAEDDVNIEKVEEKRYIATQRYTGRLCTISFGSDNRMLFDGEDIETEDFITILEMLEYVDDSPNKKVSFIGEEAQDLLWPELTASGAVTSFPSRDSRLISASAIAAR